MTRFSERNCGSRAVVVPSRSIVWENEPQLRRATKTILCGSSFVATSAPNKFVGIPLLRPLMHGTAQAIVSPSTFCLLKIGASRAGSAIGRVEGRRRSAAAFSLFRASQIFAFIERKTFGAKYRNAAIARAKIDMARTGL